MKFDQTCFAATESQCKATNYRTCKGQLCPFYKTVRQYDADRSKAEETNRRKGVK